MKKLLLSLLLLVSINASAECMEAAMFSVFSQDFGYKKVASGKTDHGVNLVIVSHSKGAAKASVWRVTKNEYCLVETLY